MLVNRMRKIDDAGEREALLRWCSWAEGRNVSAAQVENWLALARGLGSLSLVISRKEELESGIIGSLYMWWSLCTGVYERCVLGLSRAPNEMSSKVIDKYVIINLLSAFNSLALEANQSWQTRLIWKKTKATYRFLAPVKPVSFLHLSPLRRCCSPGDMGRVRMIPNKSYRKMG